MSNLIAQGIEFYCIYWKHRWITKISDLTKGRYQMNRACK